jgi:hypothetical protein
MTRDINVPECKLLCLKMRTLNFSACILLYINLITIAFIFITTNHLYNMWNAYPLLGNDRKISGYTTAVAK